MSILVGGWKLLELQPCNLPERVATGFSQVMGSMIGATYTPVLYDNMTDWSLISIEQIV